MSAYTITIKEKPTEKRQGVTKMIHTSETFGTDAKGQKLSPNEIQQIARDIAWDTFGTRVESVTCIRKK